MRTKGRTHLIYERSTGLYFANVDGQPKPLTTDKNLADLYHPLDINVIGAAHYGDTFQPILIGGETARADTYMRILGREGGKKRSAHKSKTSKKNGLVPKQRFGGGKA